MQSTTHEERFHFQSTDIHIQCKQDVLELQSQTSNDTNIQSYTV